MALIRPQDRYPRSYGNPKLYALNGSNESSGISTPIFNSESCSSESSDPKYFLDSPTEEFIHSALSSESVNRLHPGIRSTSRIEQNPFPFNRFESEYLESQSPDAIDYDEDKMKLKLPLGHISALQIETNSQEAVNLLKGGAPGNSLHNVLEEECKETMEIRNCTLGYILHVINKEVDGRAKIGV